ncbi:S-adenosylmethionine synthetase [Microbacterium testaceum]|nr:S-adenosylmethionine synthetase [Microbacterium testaceum]MDQ1177806.1 S-adenosylmethionine synthetase [Microbacterium sp. SORGH_AS_0421]MDR6099241.1 S-adenosylmethionine synthetase [Microbacterium sp. SORGH_AS_0454]
MPIPAPHFSGVALTDLRLFTSESVTEGHPDKICDQISDSILDAILTEDPTGRVAVETLVTTGLVHVAGEVSTSAYVEIPAIVRDVVNRIGYTSSDTGFDGESCGVSVSIGAQSSDIAAGVNKAFEQRERGSVDPRDLQGAGDQGIMFGFATNETPQLMPMAAWTAHRIAERLASVRKDGSLPFLRPDGKTQVTLGYDGLVPRTVDSVVLSTQHHPDISQEDLRAEVQAAVIDPVLAETGLELPDVKYYINPAGPFVIGGPKGDAGLTGRKIIIDTYGGASRHGGGAFSGKDPSKVDRSAAYAMRWVAKNAVAAGLADRLEVQVAYAIGKANPVGLYVESFGTAHVADEAIVRAIREVFDLRPAAIVDQLDLLRPIYARTATYGHFGRELPDFTWERTDRVDELRTAAGL